MHSKSLGGAELKGEVLDAQQHVLTTVSYRYFAPTITVGSVARDRWADARLAIDGFAGKLAAVCRNLAQLVLLEVGDELPFERSVAQAEAQRPDASPGQLG